MPRYYLQLKRIQCSCTDSNQAACSAIGALQPKLDSKKVGVPINIDCPDTAPFPPLSAPSPSRRKLTSNDGRLHLHRASPDGTDRLYEGVLPIPQTVVTNQDYSFNASTGNRNCEMTVRYSVEAIELNLLVLTFNFIQTVATLTVNFIRDLFNTTIDYLRNLYRAITISFRELFIRDDSEDEEPTDEDQLR